MRTGTLGTDASDPAGGASDRRQSHGDGQFVYVELRSPYLSAITSAFLARAAAELTLVEDEAMRKNRRRAGRPHRERAGADASRAESVKTIPWSFVFGFAAYFAAIWFLWDTHFVWPIRVFVVFLHEISHGVVAIATGGTIEEIGLVAQEGGHCLCPGGNMFLTASAGYLGSLAWGLLLLRAAASQRISSRLVLYGVGVLLVAASVVFIRNFFGIAFGLTFGLALGIGGFKLPDSWSSSILTVLGLTSAMYALLDIKSDVLDRPELKSDAVILEEITRIPSEVWGWGWILAGAAVSLWMLAYSYRKAAHRKAARAT